MADWILEEQRGAAAIITLNRPESLNAFPLPMVRDLRRAVTAAVNNPAVVGIIITGAGRGFCAGLDMTSLAEVSSTGSSAREASSPERDSDSEPDLPGLFSFLVEQPKPVIAAVNGVAAGGGFVLATKCDLRFASSDASFITVFSKRGLIAEHGMTWLLPKLIGTGAALDLLWSSRKVDAGEALRLGLVERVTEPEALLDEAVAYVDLLAATVSPSSMADTKRLVYEGAGQEMRVAFSEADDATWAAMDRPDPAEGAASFVERRAPRFARIGGQQ